MYSGKSRESSIGIPASIRTEHFPNKSLEIYRYTNLFGTCSVHKENLIATSDRLYDSQIWNNGCFAEIWWSNYFHGAESRLRRQIACHSVKKFSAFYETWRLHYLVHRILPVDHKLSHLNAIHGLTLYSFKICFMLFSYVNLGLQWFLSFSLSDHNCSCISHNPSTVCHIHLSQCYEIQVYICLECSFLACFLVLNLFCIILAPLPFK